MTEITLDALISPEYRAIQTNMHVKFDEYGTTSRNYAEKIIETAIRFGATSILDYGCGKGDLKTFIGGPYDFREYDPGIPGKDTLPKAADLVVCTDVLEHIEPERLDTVLDHIRQLSLKVVLIVVHTKPAKKTLPDGRNAHISLHDNAWWMDRLSRYFAIQHSTDSENGIGIVGQPYLTLGEINAVGVMTDDERFEHVRTNIKVTEERVKPALPHDRWAIVLCYGPSLKETWQSALTEHHMLPKSDFVSVSGAHDFVVEHGLIPHFHVECDPRRHKGDMVTKDTNGFTEYLYASCCHPEVVAKFKDKKLKLWHLDNGNQFSRISAELEPNCMMVGGGASVGLRAIPLLYMMGYRHFVVHGMDCSYQDDGTTHAGTHTGKKPQLIEVISFGRKFVTSPVMLAYMRQFDTIIMPHVGDPALDSSKIEIILRGDGMLQWSVLQANAATAGPMMSRGV